MKTVAYICLPSSNQLPVQPASTEGVLYKTPGRQRRCGFPVISQAMRFCLGSQDRQCSPAYSCKRGPAGSAYSAPELSSAQLLLWQCRFLHRKEANHLTIILSWPGTDYKRGVVTLPEGIVRQYCGQSV